MGAPVPSDDRSSPILLLVDDEPNVLSSLRRTLRSVAGRVLTAEGGAAALQVLEREPVDLILSDMRMPNMTGAELLGHVAEQWPDVVRILLTGYADVESSIRAINEGHIYNYLTKPWNDRELALTIRNALEKKALQDERARLAAELADKNERLIELNRNLEELVKQRTASLRKTLGELNLANEKLKQQFLQIIKALSRIIELRPEMQLGLAKLVAEQAKQVAIELELPDKAVQEIVLAGLLFQLGRLTLPERLNSRPFYLLHPKEREKVLTHPVEGEALLREIDSLNEVAAIIRSQHEKFDGSGVPDSLRGEQIPIGARIIAVARDYNLFLEGALTGQKRIVDDAQRFLKRGAGSYYDPAVVNAFLKTVGRYKKVPYRPVVEILPCQMREGMEVVEVRDANKLYLAGGRLDRRYMEKILELRDEIGVHLKIKVRIQI